MATELGRRIKQLEKRTKCGLSPARSWAEYVAGVLVKLDWLDAVNVRERNGMSRTDTLGCGQKD
jgi:hypothetical protein